MNPTECPKGGLHNYQDAGRIRIREKTRFILRVTIKCMKCGDWYTEDREDNGQEKG